MCINNNNQQNCFGNFVKYFANRPKCLSFYNVNEFEWANIRKNTNTILIRSADIQSIYNNNKANYVQLKIKTNNKVQ